MTLKELDSLSEKYKIPVISVDFLNHSYHTVQSKQLDNSRYLICTLTENGIPRGVKPDEIARLRLEKPDKTYVYNECETIEDGRILVTLTEQILAVNGKAQCDIQLTSADGIIYSTKNFIIHIDSTPYPLDAIKSSDEFDALNDIIAREGERIKIVEELEQTVTENEAVRNENENDRISSENIRKANETARQNQEDARQANENIRIANENSRKANETVRQTNETNRETNTATAISNAEKATKKANDAADDLQNKLNQHHFVLTEDKDVAGGVPSLDNNKKVPVNELYEATTSSKGITQLTDSVSSTSTTTAATPNSVKTAYDKAVSSGNDVKTHNSSSTAHTDIRNLISALTTRLNTLADSDDTTLDQLSEIVAYIKNNKSLIDGITTSKINVSDIIDNLTSSVTNKPLSAKQGKVLNDLITALTTTVGNKVDKVSGKGLSSNDYTTEEKNKLAGIAEAANRITVDSAMSASSGNPVQNKVVKSALDGKANTNHTHNYAGSANVGGSANSAVKLDSSAGSTVQPIYFKDGKPTACTYSLNASVPSGAKFTDTTYSSMTAATASAAGKAGLVPAPAAGKQTSFLRGDGTWQIPINTTYNTATQSANGLLSAADKKKLDGITANANNYAHPTTAGNKHIPAGGSSGQILRWSADGTAVWGNDNNTTYSNMTAATASAAGKAGLVPAPAAGKQASFLRGDGTWATPTDTNTWRGITDSLTSTSTTISLSAKAGKSLKDNIDTINNSLKQTTAGKFILPNGLKICWGLYEPPNANGYIRQGTVTFPITFNAAPYVFVTKIHASNNSKECTSTVAISNQTTNNVNIKVANGNSVLADYPIKVNWFAIGY